MPSGVAGIYRVELSVTNTGPSTAALVYRRTTDWDVWNSSESEFVTLAGTLPSPIVTSTAVVDTNTTQAHPDPLAGMGTVLSHRPGHGLRPR